MLEKSKNWADDSAVSLRIDETVMDLILVDMMPYSDFYFWCINNELKRTSNFCICIHSSTLWICFLVFLVRSMKYHEFLEKYSAAFGEFWKNRIFCFGNQRKFHIRSSSSNYWFGFCKFPWHFFMPKLSLWLHQYFLQMLKLYMYIYMPKLNALFFVVFLRAKNENLLRTLRTIWLFEITFISSNFNTFSNQIISLQSLHKIYFSFIN